MRSHSWRWLVLMALVTVAAAWARQNVSAQADSVDFRVLATTKTSTMEDELNEAAEAGFRLRAMSGGDTRNSKNNEVVAILSRSGEPRGRFRYKLLATKRTSTMEKELQEAAEEGYEYRDQAIFKTGVGGEEVVCILERDNGSDSRRSQYKLLATQRTSTLEKELNEVGEVGYQIVGMTVGTTAVGGREVVAILKRTR